MKKIAAIVYAFPRMEWPFLEEWCSILKDKGISKLYLGSNYPEYRIWPKKPNKKYYHLEKNDNEIESIWKKTIEKSRRHLEIENFKIMTTNLKEDKSNHIDPNDLNYHHQKQIKFVNDKIPKIARDGFEWLIACDIDEIPIANNSLANLLKEYQKFDIISAKQIVFDSRWDKEKDFAPRKIKDIKKCNLKAVLPRKCIFKPNKILLRTIHEPINCTNIKFIDPSEFVIHHFRGIEKCKVSELSLIKEFGSIVENPTKMIGQIPLL